MKKNLKDWVIATRPWSFPASSMSVVVTVAYLFGVSNAQGLTIDWLNAVLVLLMMVFFQASGNLISDCYDFRKGVDRDDTLNGVTWILNGKFDAKEIKRYGLAMLSICVIIGLVLVYRTGLNVLWIGIAGTLMAAFYPWLKYHAMGDYVILFCYALLPSLGTSIVVTGQPCLMAVVLSMTYGLITVGILHANNTRDICNDRRAGICTLAMQLGCNAAHVAYAAEMVTPYIIIVGCVAFGQLTWLALVSFITLPIAVKNLRQMMSSGFEEAEPIATLDQQTAQHQLMFSLLLSLSCIVSAFI